MIKFAIGMNNNDLPLVPSRYNIHDNIKNTTEELNPENTKDDSGCKVLVPSIDANAKAVPPEIEYVEEESNKIP